MFVIAKDGETVEPINTFTDGVAALPTSDAQDYFMNATESKVECAKDDAGAVTSCSFKYVFKRDFNSDTVPLTPAKVEPFEVHTFYELKTTSGSTIPGDRGYNVVPYVLQIGAMNSLATVGVATAALMTALAF